ncbi:MAG: DNA-binding protein, partial [Prevotella sp.]|nr:DNA-binding protein [Prevotella sp.]
DHIQDNVSAKKSDVIAVLRELVVVMAEAFDAGYGVKLDGFGRFKVGLKTKPADGPDKFSASKNIVGSRINFQPETHWSAADGNIRKNPFTTGLKVKEYGKYSVEEESLTP